MAATFEAKKNAQATGITVAFAIALILLAIYLKWSPPVIQHQEPDQELLVELNLPEDPPLPQTLEDGGGGGGNPVEAPGERGTASAPPQPGADEDSKDIDEDEKDVTPPVYKPPVTKPTATKIAENKNPVPTTPKPDPMPPAPQKPKAVLGKTTSGSGSGGGVSSTYDRSGGSGTGSGVGNGSGTGGGSGTGSGGGNGSGVGTGNGPRVTRGDRRIVRAYSFEGDLARATIYANIRVSPDGNGQFESFARGSSQTGAAYKNAIIQYLRNIKFNAADHESMVTVQFNFMVNG